MGEHILAYQNNASITFEFMLQFPRIKTVHCSQHTCMCTLEESHLLTDVVSGPWVTWKVLAPGNFKGRFEIVLSNFQFPSNPMREVLHSHS